MIAVVVAGLLLGHKAPILQTAQSRIAERTNWRTIAFILENTVFLLIGLQAEWLLDDVADSDLSGGRIVAVCGLTLVAVIVLRLVWVFPARYLLVRPGPDPVTGRRRPWTYTFLLGWAGMRGVVTLAAAFLIPEDTEHREVLLLIAFTVVAGTLLIQGLTLPGARAAAEGAVARPAATTRWPARPCCSRRRRPGSHELEQLEYDDHAGVVDLIRQRLDQRNFAAWERLGTTADQESPSDLYDRIRLAMIEAERGRILEIRDGGTVASEVISDVLATLDVEESMLDSADRGARGPPGQPPRRGRRATSCDHLAAYPAVETGADPVCQAWPTAHRWVALRHCLECGNVACCDSSPGAARHRALPRDHAPGDAVRRARRGLALVLRAPPDRLAPLRGSPSRFTKSTRRCSLAHVGPPPSAPPSSAGVPQQPFRLLKRWLVLELDHAGHAARELAVVLDDPGFEPVRRHQRSPDGVNRIGNGSAPVLPETGSHSTGTVRYGVGHPAGEQRERDGHVGAGDEVPEAVVHAGAEAVVRRALLGDVERRVGHRRAGRCRPRARASARCRPAGCAGPGSRRPPAPRGSPR